VSLVSALTSAILPVLAVAGTGYLLGRYRDVETDALATVTIYVHTPALVFHSLATTSIDLRTASALLVGVVAFSAL
jgi:predicted permease